MSKTVKELIPNVRYTNTHHEVRIECPNTLWVSVRRPFPPESVKDLMNKLNALKALVDNTPNAKMRGYNTVKRAVERYHSGYIMSYHKMCAVFECISKMSVTIENRGIRYGTVDDELLNEVMKLEQYMRDLSVYPEYLHIRKIGEWMDEMVYQVSHIQDSQVLYVYFPH